MTLALTIAYLTVGFVLMWHSASSPDRMAQRRLCLFLFGFACVSFGSAQFMLLFHLMRDQWSWMINVAHLSLLTFAVVWIKGELGWAARRKGA